MENEKKNRYIYIFCNFPVAGNEKKKKKKRKKNVGAEIGMGYCPSVLQKERILYCNTINVLQIGNA